jgi:hypothetical protein
MGGEGGDSGGDADPLANGDGDDSKDTTDDVFTAPRTSKQRRYTPTHRKYLTDPTNSSSPANPNLIVPLVSVGHCCHECRNHCHHHAITARDDVVFATPRTVVRPNRSYDSYDALAGIFSVIVAP